jgi:hypothetical protein
MKSKIYFGKQHNRTSLSLGSWTYYEGFLLSSYSGGGVKLECQMQNILLKAGDLELIKNLICFLAVKIFPKVVIRKWRSQEKSFHTFSVINMI